MFEVLSSNRRRLALYVLDDTPDNVISLVDLIDEVVTLKTALDAAPLTTDRHTEIATDLYHWHLPVLDDLGVIDCDDRHNTIRYRPDPTLETWVERARTDELAPDSSVQRSA